MLITNKMLREQVERGFRTRDGGVVIPLKQKNAWSFFGEYQKKWDTSHLPLDENGEKIDKFGTTHKNIRSSWYLDGYYLATKKEHPLDIVEVI